VALFSPAAARTQRCLTRCALVAAQLLLPVLLLLAPPAVAAPTYAPPVDAPVADPFRAPAGPYGAGNRGLEYDTSPGELVRAVGDGVVAFAGPVAGRLVVSVRHPDGLRSSLTGLAGVHVAVGSVVQQGDRIGTAGAAVHLGVRRGDTYLDPATLFAAVGEGGRVHLVPTAGAASPRATRVLSRVPCPPACR
jgi:murein DD-endopeptidase MepM/ murein hydrolase activator NlpD